MICTELPFERWLGECVWSCEASDGQTYFQNDSDGNSWIQLKKHLEENGLYLKNLILRFRDHTEVVGSSAAGYYFVHSLLATFIGYTERYFVAGILEDDGFLHCKKFLIPELIPMEESVRSPNDAFNGEILIMGKPKDNA